MSRWLLLAFVAAPLLAADGAGDPRAPLASVGKIDDLVFARWKQLGIQPADLSSDAVFLRRAYLDVIGTLPTAKEAAAFLADADPHKRSTLIDRLLARDEFADYWSMKWSDLLRVKAEFPVNLWPNAAQAYYHWIHEAVRSNQPYDQFARALLTENGSNFRNPPVNFYRAMQNRKPAGIAQTVALTFLGMRTDNWPKARLDAMAAIFSEVGYKETGEWKEEIIYFMPAAPPSSVLTFPDGSQAHLTPGQDPRQAFADWLVSPKNPYFARAIVNRIWYWLNGRGIVREADDLRPDNPPSNPELLAYLERELIASHYDLKHIYRLILESATWQLSSVPRTTSDQVPPRISRRTRCDGWMPKSSIDALCQISGLGESYTSSIPEPVTFMPDNQRAIALPDGSISSPFLELFGRPSRDTGMESERNNRFTDAQRLHLLNSTQIQRKIQQGPSLQALMRDNRGNPQELVRQVYLTILSRYPTSEEFKLVAAHAQPGAQAVQDLAWALINSSEFLFRH